MNNIEKDDLYYVTGNCFRAISCLNQVLFAKNEEYCINEKKAVTMVDRFIIKPKEYKKRVDAIFSLLSTDWDGIKKSIEILEKLICDVQKI